jgi:hypothetical protein
MNSFPTTLFRPMIRARGAKCRSLLIACLAACAALATPVSAAAAPAAAQEYVLTLPGVDKTSVAGADLEQEGPSAGAGGVVGEGETTATIGSALISLAGAAIVLPALALIGFVLLRRAGGRRAAQRPGTAG